MLWAALATAWFGGISPAHAAQRISVADVKGMIEDLAPWVEAAENRTFLDIPDVDIGTRQAVNYRLQLDTRMDGDQSDWSREYNESLANNALAIYTHGEQKIYIVKEAFEELLTERGNSDLDLEMLLKCVLVHELTHSLQHQYAPSYAADGSDDATGAQVLREGHAELAGLEYCEEESPETADYYTELSAPNMLTYGPAPTDRSSMIYGYGLEIARMLEEAGGREAVWSALQAPPPFSLMRSAIEPDAIAGWSDPDLLGSLSGDVVVGDHWKVLSDVGSPSSIQPLFIGDNSTPKALAGHYLFADRNHLSVAMLAFMMDTEEEAVELFERREQSLLTAYENMNASVFFLGTVRVSNAKELKPRSIRSLSKLDSVSRSMRLNIGNYREYWVVDGAAVFALCSNGLDIAPRDFKAIALDFREAVPTEELPPHNRPSEVMNWLAAMRDAAAVGEPQVNWRYHFAQFADRLEAGDASACKEAGELALVDVPKEQRGSLNVAIHACAVTAQDLETADAMLAQIETTAISDVSGHNHVLLLRDASRGVEALALLESLPPMGDPELALSLRTLEMIILGDIGRLAEAAELASTPDVGSDARTYIASLLANDGQIDAALAILADACPRLDGGLKSECELMMAELQN